MTIYLNQKTLQILDTKYKELLKKMNDGKPLKKSTDLITCEKALAQSGKEVAKIMVETAPKQATRYNSGKPKLSYFRRSFRQALHCIARIKEFGAVKYEEDNWRSGGKPDQEYYDSMDRHLDLFLQGEVYDKDSGCHHLGHIIWNLCALFELNYGDVPVIDQKIFDERMEYWREKKEKKNG